MSYRSSASIALLLLAAACARGQKAESTNEAVIENVALAAEAEAEADENVVQAQLPTDAWVGKWIGVEGLVLDIQKAGERGKYMLGITLLDGTKSYEGTADGDVIRFIRDGRTESVRAATGDETGLKWLAGKKNCLMVQQGEGFCRDDLAPQTPPATLAP